MIARLRAFAHRLFHRRNPPPARSRRLPVDGIFEGGEYHIRALGDAEIREGWDRSFEQQRERHRLARDTWPR